MIINLVERIPEIMAILSAVAAVWWRIDSRFEAVRDQHDEFREQSSARRTELWKALNDLERRYDQRFLSYVEASASNRMAWRKEIEDAMKQDLTELREGINYVRNRVDQLFSQRAGL